MFNRRPAIPALLVAAIALIVVGCGGDADGDSSSATSAAGTHVQIGADANSADNPLVQPQQSALAGGGIDQSLEYGDVLHGGPGTDVQVGGLGTDVLLGEGGEDVLIGGLEHFHPEKSDRKFGGPGHDILIWGVGDGSDLLDGGAGEDVLILGLVGEDEGGPPVFRASDDRRAGTVFIDSETKLPTVEVSEGPGFCEVIDESSGADTRGEFEELGVQQLVRFFLREEADSFERDEQDADNGLRQTMHLVDIEALVCPSREGGGIEVLDLTSAPPEPAALDSLVAAERLSQIIARDR